MVSYRGRDPKTVEQILSLLAEICVRKYPEQRVTQVIMNAIGMRHSMLKDWYNVENDALLEMLKSYARREE